MKKGDAQADERGAEELRRHLLRLQQEHTELKKVPRAVSIDLYKHIYVSYYIVSIRYHYYTCSITIIHIYDIISTQALKGSFIVLCFILFRKGTEQLP